MAVNRRLIPALLPQVKLLLVNLPIRVDEMQLHTLYRAMDWNLDELFMELLPYIVQSSPFDPDALHDLTIVEEYKQQPALFEDYSMLSVFLEIEFLIDYLSQSLQGLLTQASSREFNTIWYEHPDSLCFYKTDFTDLS